MTKRIHITEIKDFKAVTVRCRACGTTMTFPLAADLPVMVQCQGCQERFDLRAAYALVASLKQAQATPYKGFEVEFETADAEA